MAIDTNNILGKYRLTEELYAGDRTLVYRAVPTSQDTEFTSVVLKILRQEYPTFNDLLQFRNQYTIAKNLDIAGIVRIYSLETYQNGYILIMEDFGGISLRNYLKNNLFSWQELLQIAHQLAGILHEVHHRRVIHKDIKPANILINPTTRLVKLIDFSIASLLPKETQEIKNPHSLEGTLAYLAPEQTGRMNRGIDYRADFYAFGVTLFELLTGQLPFLSEDPIELLHCHLAQQPPNMQSITSEIPAVVSAIVAKLMAKNAEDRYQSALGLKYDLEICLEQLKSTGKIVDFPIAQRDISDRFIIPEKLYGREKEVKTLLEAFDRTANGSSELMLVAGFSGIGKTAVVNEVHKPIVRQRGYFIKGKFDQFNRNIPFSAFVQAFRNLMLQLLSESDAKLAEWKEKILQAVGENGQIIIEVIPELERLIGQQTVVAELSGNAAQNRFNLIFPKFVQVFTSKEHPLVIFLDDWQWADSASLKLLELLMNNANYLLILGAYRDNEVSPVHPFILTVEELQKIGATVNTITLTALSQSDINQLVADTLSCNLAQAEPLTILVYQKTQGNPFFVTQFLKALYQDKLIEFNPNLGYWQCDLSQIKVQSLTNDVVEFMAIQLQKLSIETQEMLKLAACIGAQFELNTLAIVSSKSVVEVATDLWKALQEGLILPQNQAYKFFQDETVSSENYQTVNVIYQFLHDRVQQAAYSLIPEEKRNLTHVQIGRLLLQIPAEQQEDKIFAIANHLNIGQEYIKDEKEQLQLAQINLLAGQRAKASTAYKAAKEYCQFGLQMLPSDAWQSEYALSLKLYEEAAETAALSGDFLLMETWIETVKNQAKTLLEQVKVYEVQIQAYTAQNRMGNAIATALDVLKNWGVEFPESPTSDDMQQAMAAIAQHLAGKDIDSLMNLLPMTDAKKMAATQILSMVMSACYIGNPALYPLVVLKVVELSLIYGTAPSSAYAYATYGLIRCAFFSDIPGGNQAAELALKLLERDKIKAFSAKIINLVYPFTKTWKYPLQELLQPLVKGYHDGIETGDAEFAAYCAYNHCKLAYFGGFMLDEVLQKMQVYQEGIQALKQDTALNFHQIYYQSVLNWMGENSEPHQYTGPVYDETVRVPIHQAANDSYSLGSFYLNKLILCYNFRAYNQAVETVAIAENYINATAGTSQFGAFPFYSCLTQLAVYPEVSPLQKSTILEKVALNLTKLEEWAIHAPCNFAHRVSLVLAEQHRVLGKKLEAIEFYDRAISEAKENQYIQEEALANELAAKFYLDWHKEKIAPGYMQSAYYCYAKWGAKAKIIDLEKHYSHLLQPILQAQKLNLNPLATLATVSNISGRTITRSSSSSSTTISDAFDFTSVLKAAQAISSTIQLDELIKQLTQIILQNSGADQCILLFPTDKQWQVRAIATPENTELLSASIDNNPDLPVSLIQYVKNTQEIVLIDNMNANLPVIDRYMWQNQPKSALCLPVVNQCELVAILYLQNQATAGVFTSDRILILDFLCTQAAISLQNARLYQQAQQALIDLKEAQLQIVQSEKMSALGNLVAGVAHEINNPVGFISGNLTEAKTSLNDLIEHLNLYRSQAQKNDIENHAEKIDLDYILADLPEIINAMEVGCDRIKNISTSLRTFSRADKDHKVSFNLHEGINSTIMILKHRLKANDNRPEIEIIKEYEKIPMIECFPGQLNQVFMNILANAIDMFDEMANTHSFTHFNQNPQQITIKTEVLPELNQIAIKIKDNGLGMTETVKARIFEHLFTTKAVGKGTGLGLTIARQIVVEKHGGSIHCASVPGQGTEFTIKLPIGK